VYTIRDCLEVAVGNRKDALNLDFFAGSGTTLHATLMLNAVDEGRRRCFLATDNEVEEKLSKTLQADGVYPGDSEFERHGIFEAATRPRVEAAITGRRPDGTPVPGDDIDGRSYALGFPENCEFFAFDYLNSDRIELGLEHEALHPVYWMAAGANGKRPERISADEPFALVPKCGYAVLFDPMGLAAAPSGVLLRGEDDRGLASRLYAQTLARRILAAGTLRRRVEFCHGCGVGELARHVVDNPDAAAFIDPPYTASGRDAGLRLYRHVDVDHERVFALAGQMRGHVLLTYDDNPATRALAMRSGLDTRSVTVRTARSRPMRSSVVSRW
jgi:hypothetical protein